MQQSLKPFTDLVHKMRLAQKRYFELMGKARKTNHPETFDEARKVLQISKDLEIQVDTAIDEVNKMMLTPEPLPESAPAPKSYFETENF